MKAIPDGSIDMICADLPYAVSNAKWDKLIPFEPMWEQFLRVCKKNAAIVLFAQSPFDKELALSQKKIFRYELIWEKHHQTGFYNANKMPLRTHENILVFYRALPTYNPIKTQGHPRKTVKADSRKSIQSDIWNKVVEFKDYDSTERYPRSVLKFKSDKYQNALHHTQKPVKLVETLLKYYSNEGDVILDPTVGSGTTAVAAMNTGRNFIAIEKDDHYYEVAMKRINDHEIESN